MASAAAATFYDGTEMYADPTVAAAMSPVAGLPLAVGSAGVIAAGPGAADEGSVAVPKAERAARWSQTTFFRFHSNGDRGQPIAATCLPLAQFYMVNDPDHKPPHKGRAKDVTSRAEAWGAIASDISDLLKKQDVTGARPRILNLSKSGHAAKAMFGELVKAHRTCEGNGWGAGSGGDDEAMSNLTIAMCQATEMMADAGALSDLAKTTATEQVLSEKAQAEVLIEAGLRNTQKAAAAKAQARRQATAKIETDGGSRAVGKKAMVGPSLGTLSETINAPKKRKRGATANSADDLRAFDEELKKAVADRDKREQKAQADRDRRERRQDKMFERLMVQMQLMSQIVVANTGRAVPAFGSSGDSDADSEDTGN